MRRARRIDVAVVFAIALMPAGCSPLHEFAGDPFLPLERQLAVAGAAESTVDPFLAADDAGDAPGTVRLDAVADAAPAWAGMAEADPELVEDSALPVDSASQPRSSLLNTATSWATSSPAQLSAKAAPADSLAADATAGRPQRAVSYAAFTCQVAEPAPSSDQPDWQPRPQTVARPVAAE